MNAQITKEEFGYWGFRGSVLLMTYLVFVLLLPFFLAQSVQWLTLIVFIAAGCGIAPLLWGKNDLAFIVRLQLEYTIFCAAGVGSLAFVFFFVPVWTGQEALALKTIGAGSSIIVYAASWMWWSFNKKYPPAKPRDLVQFALKAGTFVGIAGCFIVYAIMWLVPDIPDLAGRGLGVLTGMGFATVLCLWQTTTLTPLWRKAIAGLFITLFFANMLLWGFLHYPSQVAAFSAAVIGSVMMILAAALPSKPATTE